MSWWLRCVVCEDIYSPKRVPPPSVPQSVPTFSLYRGRELVATMTGAKIEKLRELVEANL